MENKRSYEELKAEIGALSIEEIRATPAGKKIDQVFALTEAWQESIKDQLKARNPLANDDEINQEIRCCVARTRPYEEGLRLGSRR